MIRRECPVTFQTQGPGHHFFGYYDKSPLDRAERRLLAHRALFDYKRLPRADDVVEIGYWDLDRNAWNPVSETRAYNWQQGAQLQWLPPDHATRIIFNDRENDRFVSRVVNVTDGSTRTLPFPIYTVHPGGGSAICVNYERLYFPRPGYAYEGIVRPEWDRPIPDGDGLFRLDLETGEHERILSTRQMTECNPISSMENATHYLEHAMFNPDGSRFSFLHRWQLPDGGLYTRLWTANERGGELRCLLDSGMFSHSGWRTPEELVGWGRPASGIANLRKNRWISGTLLRALLPVYRRLVRPTGAVRRRLLRDTYLHFDLAAGGVSPLAPGIEFPDDGHCTWSPRDARWMLTDTYQDEAFYRHLLLYDHAQQELVEIGRFYSLPETCDTGYRCDLHPRWGHSGNLVCIDSIHERGERQMYLIDVSGVVAGT